MNSQPSVQVETLEQGANKTKSRTFKNLNRMCVLAVNPFTSYCADSYNKMQKLSMRYQGRIT